MGGMRRALRRTSRPANRGRYDRNGRAQTAVNLSGNPGGLVVAGSNPAAPTNSPDQNGAPWHTP